MGSMTVSDVARGVEAWRLTRWLGRAALPILPRYALILILVLVMVTAYADLLHFENLRAPRPCLTDCPNPGQRTPDGIRLSELIP